MANYGKLRRRIVLPKRGHWDTLGTYPIFFLLHDAGSNEDDVIDRVRPYLHEMLTIVSIRGPIDLGNGKYAWFDPELAADNELPLQRVAERHQKLYDYMRSGKFSMSLLDARTWLYCEGQAGILGLYNYQADRFVADSVITVGARFPVALRQPPDKRRIYARPDLYLAHGLHDAVVPIEEARELRAWLLTSPAGIAYSEHEMGHTPSDECLATIHRWLSPFNPPYVRGGAKVEAE